MLTNPVRQFLIVTLLGISRPSTAAPFPTSCRYASRSRTRRSIPPSTRSRRETRARLRRMRNIAKNPTAAVVGDHYDDDWAKLGWVMLRGRAEILSNGTEHDRA